MTDTRGAPLAGRATTTQPCPACEHVGLVLTWALTAKPLGSHSLSGGQMKVSALNTARCRCPECGWAINGRMDGGTVNAEGTAMVGGSFTSIGKPCLTGNGDQVEG